MTTLIKDDLLSERVLQDPYSYFGGLREESPVYWNSRWRGWIVTRYDDIVSILHRHSEFSSDRMAALRSELSESEEEKYRILIHYLSNWLALRDPPFHTKLRMVLNKAFAPSTTEVLRPRVRSIASQLAGSLRKNRRRKAEFVAEFAAIFPSAVICEYMGIPLRDREILKQWSDDVGSMIFLRAGESARRERAQDGMIQLLQYFRPLLSQRRLEPSNDLISRLVEAQRVGELTEDEVLATCTTLFLGGSETTSSLLANGLRALMEDRLHWERLREQGEEIIQSTVEELLRYDGPAKAATRRASIDCEIRGQLIRKGDRLLLGFCAGNRDPRVFQEPDRLDLTRKPNRHLGFGEGIHFCLGASLARLEAQEALLALTREVPNLRLAPGRLTYQPALISRSLKELWVEW